MLAAPAAGATVLPLDTSAVDGAGGAVPDVSLDAAPSLDTAPQLLQSPSLPPAPGLPDAGGALPSAPAPGSLLEAAGPTGSVPTGGEPSASPGGDSGGAGSASARSPGTAGGPGTTGRDRERGDRGTAAPRPEARFEAAVRRLRGCLSALSSQEWPVAVMRAGIARNRSLSRAEVARRLDIPRARVHELERSALRTLHRAARAGDCDERTAAATVDASGVPPLVSRASLAAIPALLTHAELAHSPDEGGRASSPTPPAVAGAFHHGGDGRGVGGLPLGASDSVSVLAVALGVAALVAAGLVLYRRRSHLA